MKMDKILKEAQKMQTRMAQLQDELASRTVEAAAGGGMVRVQANGAGDLVSVKIAPEVVDPQDVELLEDLILSATREALRLGREMANDEMGKVTGGLALPGLF